MKTAFAVIGANWGDEGKGLAVDARASALIQNGHAVTVVRSNGGAQAGHSVVCPNHGRHVFHHIGAGTLAGAATHLSRFFVAHPMMLADELSRIKSLGVPRPRMTIDPRAPITSPWDMAINQALEIARGAHKHGSTGLGFGETIERMEKGPALVAQDLYTRGLAEKLDTIRRHWLPLRKTQLGLIADDSPLGAVLSGAEDAQAVFLRDCEAFVSAVELFADGDLAGDETIVFEGAQGLQLDMNFGRMPHVTRSRTGLANMIRIANECGITSIHTSYMTRTYATRHGAGPLPHEAETPNALPWLTMEDRTNAPNPWQGTLRLAPLDLDALNRAINADLQEQTWSDISIDPHIGITCLDQINEAAPLIAGGQTLHFTAKDIPLAIGKHVGLKVAMQSWGDCRDKVIMSEN